MQEKENNEDFKKPSKCAIRVSLKENKLNIHKSTIAMLNKPKYIQLLINKQSNIFLVKGCDKKERDSFEVPEDLFSRPRADYTLHSKVFADAIRKQTGWEADSVYRMNGYFLQDLSVVEFNLNNGKRLFSNVAQ